MISDLQLGVRCAVQCILRLALRGTSSIGQSYLIGSQLVITVLTLLIASMPASGQVRPAAPEQLCIVETGDCAAPDDGDVPKPVRWNPGHYLKTQGNHAPSNVADYLSDVTRQLAKTEDSSEIRGALVSYAWGMIEPSLGNYDWGPIYTHLNYLADRGKKLIVIIEFKCFRSSCPTLAPAELAGQVFVTSRESLPTQIIEIWEEPNMDLFIAFWQAMATEFDSNPAFEMVLGSESAPSLQGGTPQNYSRSGYATQLKRMYAAQGAAFETTNVVANINFLANQLSGLIEQAYQAGVGRGMPDVVESDGSIVFRGECDGNDCGVRDYRGLIPHLGIVSSPTLKGADPITDTPAEVIAYGLATNITHYTWVSSLGNEDSWANIIRAVEGTNPNGHVACPTRYAGGCQ